MKQTKSMIFIMLILYIVTFSFFHMQEIILLTNTIKEQVFIQLFPTLFPFMLILTFCQKIGIINIFAYFLQYLSYPLFQLSGYELSLYLFSILCGYPTNAKIISDSYHLGYIDDKQLQKLMYVAHHASFSFIIYYIGSHLFHDIRIGFLIECFHLLPTFLYLLFSKSSTNKLTYDKAYTTFQYHVDHKNFLNLLLQSLRECIFAFIYIFGFMLISRLFLISLSSFFLPNTLSFLGGFIEFSSGITDFCNQDLPTLFRMIMTLFYLSFGGLSIFLQISPYMLDTSFHYKKYLLFRFFHACTSIVFFMIYLMI